MKKKIGIKRALILFPFFFVFHFHFVILARKIAESFRTPVFILTDANLATGQQPFPRPKPNKDWFSPPIDQSPWKKDVDCYAWDEKTGLSRRPIPGQPFGMYTLTGLAHSSVGKVSYDPENNQKTSAYRSKKLNTFRNTLKPPVIHGDDEGDDSDEALGLAVGVHGILSTGWRPACAERVTC